MRSARLLPGTDAYILVLDTKGINVWCAAGKGTFGTEELVRRIEMAGLCAIVSHRRIILPQLGAPGISAHEVSRRSGFSVEYGPFRARDLPAYLATHTATREMRTVRFTLADRLILAPVELVHIALPALAAAVILFILAGPVAALAAVAAVLAGTVLFPALLPAIPTRDFSTKGFFLGAVVAIPFAASFALAPGMSGIAQVIAVLCTVPSHAGRNRVPRPQLHGLDYVYLPDRSEKRDLPVRAGDGADGRCRDDPRDRAGNPPGHGGGLMPDSYAENTLRYFPDRCINCPALHAGLPPRGFCRRR